VRELLLKLEAEPLDGNLWRLNPDDLGISDRTYEEISYHLELLIDGGLLDAKRELSGQFVARKLTWAGHDFLDSVRDSKVWRTTKDRVKAAGGFTIEILASVAKKVIEEKLAALVGATLGS
jgi:DNA-binding transcriptional ArsR family regulator